MLIGEKSKMEQTPNQTEARIKIKGSFIGVARVVELVKKICERLDLWCEVGE